MRNRNPARLPFHIPNSAIRLSLQLHLDDAKGLLASVEDFVGDVSVAPTGVSRLEVDGFVLLPLFGKPQRSVVENDSDVGPLMCVRPRPHTWLKDDLTHSHAVIFKQDLGLASGRPGGVDVVRQSAHEQATTD